MDLDPIGKDLRHLKRFVYSSTRNNCTYHAWTPCRIHKLKCLCSGSRSSVACEQCVKRGKKCVWTAARTKRGCEEILTLGLLQSRSLEKVGNYSSKEISTRFPVESVSSREALSSQVAAVKMNNMVDEHGLMDLDSARSLLFDESYQSMEGALSLPLNIRVGLYGNGLLSKLSHESSGRYTTSVAIMETRKRLLRASDEEQGNGNEFLALNECFLYLWGGIETIRKLVKTLFFPSSAHTTTLINTQSYIVEIENFQPRLRGWRKDLDKIACLSFHFR